MGALHCITKEVGVNDPLLISHQELHDTYDTISGYVANAFIKHRTGITSATLYYTTDTSIGYTAIPMYILSSANDSWGAVIPSQQAGTTVYYYISANSTSGKTQVRPMPAPSGFFSFNVLQVTEVNEEIKIELQQPYPNPSKGITCVPIMLSRKQNVSVSLFDLNGKVVVDIYNGELNAGARNLFINTINLSSGVYILNISNDTSEVRQKLVVR